MTSAAPALQEAPVQEPLLGEDPFTYPRTKARELCFPVFCWRPQNLKPMSWATEGEGAAAHLMKSVEVCF